jgi:hypothetical protein
MAAERKTSMRQKNGNPRILDIRALAKETEGMSEKFCGVWAFRFRKKFVRAKR